MLSRRLRCLLVGVAVAQLIILTDSHDTTTDLLIRHMALSHDQVFRLNYDFFSSYKISITPGSFAIEDPCGRIASTGTVTKFLFRKPNRPRLYECDVSRYVESEQWASIRAIISLVWRASQIVLVEPHDASLRLEKMTQLTLASNLFPIPQTSFSFNTRLESVASNVLVKSLSGMWVGKSFIYATQVTLNELDTSYPWLIQECVDARFDITVVFIRGRTFAYKLDRKRFVERGIIDWKQEMGDHGLHGWEWFKLDDGIHRRIVTLMEQFALDYGRLDFLEMHDGELVFLEVNPNGQFAWLDVNDNQGLISSYCDVINPNTVSIPIPWSPYVTR